MKAKTLRETFRATDSFWIFLLYGILTGGVYLFCWGLRTIEVCETHYSFINEKDPTLIASTRKLLWISVGLFYFIVPLVGERALNALVEADLVMMGMLSIASGLLQLAALVLFIITAFKLRSLLSYVFEQENKSRVMKGIWTFLFQDIYLYYAIGKADDDHAFAQAQAQATQQPQ